MLPLIPGRGGFLRPFGCGWFIREYLLGLDPEGSLTIDPDVGACQEDIFYHYKLALHRAHADFRPNEAKRHLTEELSKRPQEQAAELPPSAIGDSPYDTWERLSQLPPLLMEAGAYCALIREARDVFVNGHFYACVAMCGISLERFQRDKAAPFGAARKKIEEVRQTLKKNKVLLPETLALCTKMAKLRDRYAHGRGSNPKEDALNALAWMHSFIDKETNLMRDYIVVDGILNRKRTAIQTKASRVD